MKISILTYQKIVLLFTVFFVVACNDQHSYNVPTDVSKYVLQFESEAAKRNKNFDFSTSGLIIEFTDLKDNTAGLCHYEQPIRIEIDSIYWNAIGKTAGAELMRENLIFHELGHGFLKRPHNNDVLENGDWKSIMCGGEKVNNRSWNINYRGLRREYYLDELFNESTPQPEFSSLLFVADSTGFTDKIKLSFDTEAQAGWKIGVFDAFETSIDNGRLKFASKTSATYLVFAQTPVDVMSDFVYEFSIQSQPKNETDQFGMVFGTMTDSIECVEFFNINQQKKAFTGNRNWYSFYTELTCNEIDAVTKLKVIKMGTLLYYFINDRYIYQNEAEVSQKGNHFGFLVPAYATVWLENLRIGTKSASNIKSANEILKQLKFQIMKTSAINTEQLNK